MGYGLRRSASAQQRPRLSLEPLCTSAQRAEVEVQLGEVVRDLAARLVSRGAARELVLERRDLALEHLHSAGDGGGVARDLVGAHALPIFDRPRASLSACLDPFTRRG